MARFQCTGELAWHREPCALQGDDQAQAQQHAAASGHRLEEYGPPRPDDQSATHITHGGYVVSGYCFDCGTHVPASEQAPLASD